MSQKRKHESESEDDGLLEVSEEHHSKFYHRSKKIIDYLRRDKEKPKGKLMYYQRDAVLATRKEFVKEEEIDVVEYIDANPVLIVAPTGAGKSGIIVLLPYVLSSENVLVLTPSKVISHQLAIAFGDDRRRKSFFEVSGMMREGLIKEYRPEVQIIKESSDIVRNQPREVMIVNAQKFGGRAQTTLSLMYRNEELIADVREFFKSFDLLIVDEAHHYPAETWVNIVNEFHNSKCLERPKKRIVFLTATPYHLRATNREVQVSAGEGPDRRSSSIRIAYEITNRDTRRGKATRPCKFVEENCTSDPETLARHIKQYLDQQKQEEGRFTPQAMVIVRRADEAVELATEMNDIHSDKKFAVAICSANKNRIEDQQKFDDGKYRVAVICKLLMEGYDNDKVTLCVIRRNVQSKILFTQFIGRCMRMKRFKNADHDQTTGIVLTYKEFNQRKMWNDRDEQAEDHPDDRDIEIDLC